MFQSTAFQYSMTNCLYASIIDKIVTNCSCLPIFADKGHQFFRTAVQHMSYSDGPGDGETRLPLCIGPKLACMEVCPNLVCDPRPTPPCAELHDEVGRGRGRPGSGQGRTVRPRQGVSPGGGTTLCRRRCLSFRIMGRYSLPRRT